MFSQSIEQPGMLQWLLEWKKKKNSAVRIISVNNEGKELNQYRIKKFGLSNLFDAFVSSCEVGMRKPDPGIFQLALGIAQADPHECLYFDDRSILVEAAKKLGIQARQHKDFESTRKIIEEMVPH